MSTARDYIRERIADLERRDGDGSFRDESATAEEVLTAERRGYLETVREFDPSTMLNEELLVRLSGPGTTSAMPLEWGKGLLPPLEELLDGVSGEHVPFELSGVSHGSTILHLRPSSRDVEHVAGAVPVDESPADLGVRAALQFMQTLESSDGDVRPFAGSMAPMGKLVEFLKSRSLNLGLTWEARSGDVKAAALTNTGIRRYETLAETETVPDEFSLGGFVTELHANGLVKVKTAQSRTAPAYQVRFEADSPVLKALHLGERVHMRVRSHTERNRLQDDVSVRHEFVRLLSRDEKLDF